LAGEKVTDFTNVPSFTITDSGERQQFAGGMQRDTAEGKPNFLSARFGPMYRRWVEHMTKGRTKYPDSSLGTPNWTLARGPEEYIRGKESAARHFEQWLAGERDEDHAAAVFFNINLAEYVLELDPTIDPALGAGVAPVPSMSVERTSDFQRALDEPKHPRLTALVLGPDEAREVA
jgi:hypothetical protein